MSVDKVRMDPDEKFTLSFSAVAWLAAEGTTLSTFPITTSATVTQIGASSEAGGVVTGMFSATASGTATCHFVFADGQERDRTMTIVIGER